MITCTDTMQATAVPFAAPVGAVAGTGAVAMGIGAPVGSYPAQLAGPFNGGTGICTAKLEQQWSNRTRHLGDDPISAPARHLGRSPT